MDSKERGQDKQIKVMKKKAVQHLQSIGVHDEYGTPREMYEDRCDLYKIHPTIDVCATKINNVCSKFYTKEEDFFTKKTVSFNIILVVLKPKQKHG